MADIKKLSNKQAEILMYGNIGDWHDGFDGLSFVQMLERVEKMGYSELLIRMHCYGGSVTEGNAIYNAIQRSKLNITIVIDGVAASMGCFILPACKNVLIAENAMGMVHRPSSGIMGDADDLENTAKMLRDMEDSFIKRLTERSPLTAEQIKAMWFDGKDYWLNAEEMVRYGIATKVVNPTVENVAKLDVKSFENMDVEAVYNRFTACLNVTKHNKNEQSMKKLLIAAFALQGVTEESDDASVLAALQAKQKTLSDTVERLEKEDKAKTETMIKAMLDRAQEVGKFANAGKDVAATRAVYENIGKTSGADVLESVLATLATAQPKSIVQEMAGAAGAKDTTGAEPKTFAELVALGNDTMSKWRTEKREDYARLYKAEFGHEPIINH